MVKEPLAQSQSLPKPDRSKLLEYPTLSLKERDRRWSLVRKMMEENEIEALMVLPGGPFDDPSNYLTNSGRNLLFFPLQGEPIVFLEGSFWRLSVPMNSEMYGIEPWVKWRYVEGIADEWIKILRESGRTSSRIGIIGSSHFFSQQQQRTASLLTNSIKKVLPNVTFVDLWKQYVQIWLVKSEEEITMFRKAALALEVAAEEFVNTCKPGNTLADIQTAVLSAVIPYGVDLLRPEVSSGPDGGRGILWLGAGLKPPIVSKGDLIYSELFAWVGPLHAQAQICVSVGEPTEEKKKLASLAREAYEIGVKTICPGITFGDLAEAMNKPNRREGAWKLTPLVHSLNPLEPVDKNPEGMLGPRGFPGLKERVGDLNRQLLESSEGRPRRFDLVIQEGWTFQFEPNSCYGRTYVDIGGNILVTKDGCEELNKIPTRMVVVPA